MEQLSLFPPPHRYIIDSSSIFSQKQNEQHRRCVYKKLWDNIDDFLKKHIIVTCSEIESEIKDPELVDWLHLQECCILPITDDIQEYVRKIVNEHPKLIDFNNCKSSGDAFLIATAMKYGLTVITEENKQSPKKIPWICETYDIPCINITELCTREEWEF